METQQVRRLKDKAIRYFEKQKFKKALKVYNSLVELDARDVSTLLKVGELSRRLGDPDAAVAAYARAAECYARDGMLLRGIAVCKVILDIEPEHTATQNLFAELYTRRYGGLPVKRSDTKAPPGGPIGPEGPPSDPGLDGNEELAVDIDLSELERRQSEGQTTPPTDRVGGDDEVQLIPSDGDADEEVPLVPAPRIETLPRIPLFSDLDRESFIELLQRIPLYRFDPEEQIVNQGDEGHAFYIITSGEVRVVGQPGGEIASLGPGAFFGEMALITSRPRQASVFAQSPCEILEISKAELDRLGEKSEQVYEIIRRFTQQRLLHNLMRTSPLFVPFGARERQALMNRFDHRQYPRNQEIISQGQAGHGLLLIVDGEVTVTRESKTGGERKVSTLSNGDIFGEIALLTKSPAIATVRTTTPLDALYLPKDAFDDLIMTHPQILVLVSDLADDRQEDIEERLRRSIASGLDGGAALL